LKVSSVVGALGPEVSGRMVVGKDEVTAFSSSAFFRSTRRIDTVPVILLAYISID
jgi:hypothetical protein